MGVKPDENDVFKQVLPLFNAMGDKTRQQVMALLACHDQLSVKELTSYTSLSRPAISHHIKVLREAGLVVQRREGVKRYYRPTFIRYVEPMKMIIRQVEAQEQQNITSNGEK